MKKNEKINEDLDEDLDLDQDLDDDDLIDELDDEDDDISISIVTNVPQSENIKNKVKTKRSKVIGKHTLAYDTIHKTKIEAIDMEEEYIIQDLNSNFSVSLNIDTEQNYNSDDYYFSIELKNKVLNLLTEHTDIDFSPETKRRIPSVNDLNAYYQMLINELADNRYSYTEIFTSLSEFFTDNIWNVYKKLNNHFKSAIFEELKEKYSVEVIESMDFL